MRKGEWKLERIWERSKAVFLEMWSTVYIPHYVLLLKTLRLTSPPWPATCWAKGLNSGFSHLCITDQALLLPEAPSVSGATAGDWFLGPLILAEERKDEQTRRTHNISE